jgi:predicted site-specific integrase-resolvase
MTLLRMEAASKYCGLHSNTIRKYIDSGIIRGIRINTYRYIDTSELDRLMKNGTSRKSRR